MSFCKTYNKIMKRLNEFYEPVSEINIFIGTGNIISSSFSHIFILGFCYTICLFDKMAYPLKFIESRTHIYKKVICPILDWFEQVEQDIIFLISDKIYSITTSKCTKKYG